MSIATHQLESPLPSRSSEPLGRASDASLHLAIRGSIWTIVGFGASQGLRLGSNLVLTRLLFPEAFGLLALVNVFIHGVQLFSDFGIRGSVIHNPRGDEPDFLNTAWTLRVIRGVVLWTCIGLLAWPASRFYAEPKILLLMPVVGLAAIIDGFASTATFSLLRQVRVGRIACLELIAQLAGVLVMIVWAIVAPSVWVLVAGALSRAASYTVMSHLLLPGRANRFAFDREAARAMFNFGRWIFLATAATFIASQADRAVLGKFISASQLGVYSVAVTLALVAVQASQQLASRVLFPVYARLAEGDRGRLRQQTFRIRAMLLACFLPPLWCLVLWGPGLVCFLYDARYSEAGWMLRILAAGGIASVVTDSSQAVVLAHGDSFRHMLLQLAKALLFLAMGAVGGVIAGIPGFLVGIALSRAAAYLAVAFAIRRFGTWLPALDGTAFVLSATVVAIALWLG